MEGRYDFLRGLVPFIPVVIGIGLKFALIDKPGQDLFEHFYSTYLAPAWIEFLVTAFVIGITAMLSQPTVNKTDILVFAALPALCFVVCTILALGTAKARIESSVMQVYMPGILAAISLGISGGRVGKAL
ncbi:hypothetical protein SAMN06297251_10348 [Fulvimarina manganoxydans]|uniref:Uncharacterized protein n=1 Tax=Fulvimarina manganoxydans TaxID=937218 RepID=A0A1W1ZQB8_9HYPH|nr:hypothetical protein [Fulvimarina manganoxydans]SMC50735.1 hypothetical protein SAMN06297251_10348 [Fulvimarina manganoxydans]